MVDWNKYKTEFDPDGSLRDIYLLNTNKQMWNLFIKNIINTTYKKHFCHGDKILELPESFDAIKNLQQTEPTTLKIFLESNTQVNCHFFTEEEIELDIDPKEINGISSFKELVDFLNWLYSISKKTVILTHENSPNNIILAINK